MEITKLGLLSRWWTELWLDPLFGQLSCKDHWLHSLLWMLLMGTEQGLRLWEKKHNKYSNIMFIVKRSRIGWKTLSFLFAPVWIKKGLRKRLKISERSCYECDKNTACVLDIYSQWAVYVLLLLAARAEIKY